MHQILVALERVDLAIVGQQPGQTYTIDGTRNIVNHQMANMLNVDSCSRLSTAVCQVGCQVVGWLSGGWLVVRWLAGCQVVGWLSGGLFLLMF